MVTILFVLSAACFALAVPAYFWPHRLSPTAQGWRMSGSLASKLWGTMGAMWLGLAFTLVLHSTRGWDWPTIVCAATNAGGIVLFLRSFLLFQKPLPFGHTDDLFHRFHAERGQLSAEEQIAKMENLYETMIAELDVAELYLRAERPHDWENRLAKVQKLREETQAALEALKKGLPPPR